MPREDVQHVDGLKFAPEISE